MVVILVYLRGNSGYDLQAGNGGNCAFNSLGQKQK